MSLQEFISRHGYVAVFILIMLEEIGIPMPIPTDVLVVIVGYQLRVGAFHPLIVFPIMLTASTIGATILYFVVRQGGRPLIERFGRYVHLKPEHLERSERWINRMGWLGIAIGRAIPGVRYATVISCGLFRVPYWRFITAHLAGTSVNMLCFIMLGWTFGPRVVEYLHLPQVWLRGLALVIVSIALPALVFWLYRRSGGRAAAEGMPPIAPRRALMADVLTGFVGAIEVTSVWSAATIIGAELTRPERPVETGALTHWFVGRGITPIATYLLIYLLLALLGILISVLYHELPLEQRLPHVGRVAVLAVAGQLLIAMLAALALLVRVPKPLTHWWSDNWIVTASAVIFGMIGYAIIAVYGRILAVRALTPRANGNLTPPGPKIEPQQALEALDTLEPIKKD